MMEVFESSGPFETGLAGGDVQHRRLVEPIEDVLLSMLNASKAIAVKIMPINRRMPLHLVTT